MDDAALQTVYRWVVIAKLQYSSSAWWGFTNTSDRERVSVHPSQCALQLRLGGSRDV